MALTVGSRRKTRSKGSLNPQEASRLVFVFVKDAKPKRYWASVAGRRMHAWVRGLTDSCPMRRKVAVPVPDGYDWMDFIHQVKSKLRITGIKEIFLASVRCACMYVVERMPAQPCASMCMCRAGTKSPASTSFKTSTSCALWRWGRSATPCTHSFTDLPSQCRERSLCL